MQTSAGRGGLEGEKLAVEGAQLVAQDVGGEDIDAAVRQNLAAQDLALEGADLGEGVGEGDG